MLTNETSVFLPKRKCLSLPHYEIEEFCKPYFERLNLNYFHYFRYYESGHIFTLNHNQCLGDYYWSKTNVCTVPEEALKSHIDELNVCTWQATDAGYMVEDFKNILGLNDLISLSLMSLFVL